MKSSHLSITAYLVLLISLGYVATDIYLPSLPALSIYFQASDHHVQMTLFSYLLSFSLTPLLCGPLSDQFGRKKVILGGLFVSIAATFGCLYAESIQGLIAFRFLQGIGTGTVMISSRATVSDLFTGKELAKQMLLTTMLMPLILAVAPSLGGYLQQTYGWQAIFIFLVFYMTFIALWASLRTESLQKISPQKFSQIFSTYRLHFKNRLFLAYGVNFILPAFGLFGYMTVSPFLFQEVIGLSPLEYGTLALYVGVVIMATGYLSYRLIQHIPVTHILYAGGAVSLFAGSLLLTFHFMHLLTFWTLLIPSLLFVTCIPLCLSNAASKSLNQIKTHFGAASALLTTFQFLAGALGSFIFTLVSDKTAFSLSICFIVVGFLSLINLRYATGLEQSLQKLEEA